MLTGTFGGMCTFTKGLPENRTIMKVKYTTHQADPESEKMVIYSGMGPTNIEKYDSPKMYGCDFQYGSEWSNGKKGQCPKLIAVGT